MCSLTFLERMRSKNVNVPPALTQKTQLFIRLKDIIFQFFWSSRKKDTILNTVMVKKMKKTADVLIALIAQMTAVLHEENSQQTTEEDEDCEDDKELTDADIKENLSSSVLTLELTNTFTQLLKVRKEVIFLSHLENHGVMEEYDISSADLDFDLIPDKNVDSLNLSRRVTPEMVDLLGFILKGMRTKRAFRPVGQKGCGSDNEYREDFLNFLKVCWDTSGAQGRENVLEENEEQVVIIRSMEKAIAKVISRFLFLDYMCCIASSSEGK